jgi:ribosomal protein S18 acetylase RimI-like enzyme
MKIVFEGKTKIGKEIIIRYPRLGDHQEMQRYINELSKEKTFIRFQGEEISLEEELKYLDGQLERIKQKTAVKLLAFLNNKIVGITEVNMKDKTEKHIGILGISVAKDYRSEGIGRKLMELVLKEAEENLPDLKIVILEVYSTNIIARKMYEKLGFANYGALPNGIMRNSSFEDAILMYKNVNLA